MNKLVDAHCHVITDPDNTFCGDDGGSQGTLRCVMSSNPYDWNNLKKLAGRSTSKNDICVGFGVHPWYSHLFYVGSRRDKVSHYQDVLEYKNEEQFDSLVQVLPEPLDLPASPCLRSHHSRFLHACYRFSSKKSRGKQSGLHQLFSLELLARLLVVMHTTIIRH